MARIPQTEIERLKEQIPIETLAEARGVKLKRHGVDLIGLCPFHDDKAPSLVISPTKKLWHCLGACKAGGSVIDWVMKAEGVSFRHAVEILRKDYPSLATKVRPAKTARKLAPLVSGKARDGKLLAQVVDYYHQTLKENPQAKAYLEARGIDDPQAIARFKLGYANRTLGYRLPQKNRKAGAQARSRLQALGILRKSGHEHFNGSIVIPVLGKDGEVTEIYGRKILSNLRKGTPLHLYLPGPHQGVWNEEGLATGDGTVILCESLIDALTFWCAGFHNTTASYGIEGFTKDHLAAFKRHGVKKVLIAYDADPAGEKAARALAQKLADEGIACLRVHFPKGMDANDYALKVRPAKKSLGLAVEKATFLAGPPAPPAAKGEKKAPAQAAPPPGPKRQEPSPPPPPPTPPQPRSPDTPQPGGLPDVPAAQVSDREVVVRLGDRRYRVRGLTKNLSYESLKVNVLASRAGTPGFHVDTLDLYSARHRQAFTRQAALEMDLEEPTVRKDLGRVLLKLEELQEAQISKALAPREEPVTLTEEERAAAMALLTDPSLLESILFDFAACGVVGEETNKLVGYLAAVSRKLEDPLAVIVQSSSAAGKTSLMEAILALVPEEDRVKYSAMTGQSLFYMGERDLAHKILAIVEEEGAERASYALKLLQSEGELTIASTGKDAATGRLVTQEYQVKGPVMILLTTTAVEVDEELRNRCIVLTVDEDREQTRAIHRLQRESQTLEGLLARRSREKILELHRNAQRLLRPLLVANPFARELTFLDDKTRMRRDHLKYLTLIRAITLLRQYQRPVKTTTHQGETIRYVEVTLEDIATANRLAHEVLGRSLDDLAPQTRRLLLLLDEMVTARCGELGMDRVDFRFSRREIRDHTGWGDSSLKVHLRRLEELEYLLAHRGRRGQSFQYELVFDGNGLDGNPFLMGLLDVEKLREDQPPCDYDEKKSGVKPDKSGQNGQKSYPGHPRVMHRAGPSQGGRNGEKPHRKEASGPIDPKVAENAHLDPESSGTSYPHPGRTAADPSVHGPKAEGRAGG